MNNYLSLKDYVIKNFDREKIKFIANEGFNAGINELDYEENTPFLFDKYSQEIWHILYFCSQEYELTIPKYLSLISHDERELETLDEFKDLIVWHAIQKICCNFV